MIGAGASPPAAPTTPGSGNGSDSGGSDGGKTIALLLPESKTTRYEAFDKPLFEAKVKELCSDCTVDYYNADQDEAKQAQQMTRPSTPAPRSSCSTRSTARAPAAWSASAQQAGAKVIAYDRFIEDADYYMSFDNETVGKMQAEAWSTAMGDKGDILMLNGAPSDPNAAQFKAGAAQRARHEQRQDPRGVRQPRLEPGERPAVRHRPAEQVRPLGDQGRLRRQRRPGRRRGRRADRRRRRRPTRCRRSPVRTPSSPRSSASSPASRR